MIHFLTADINYGGRVTDDVDRRTMNTILADFVDPGVLSDDYKFSPSGELPISIALFLALVAVCS